MKQIHSKHPLETALPIEAESGDVLFFHSFTLHGSMPNRSERPRKTILIQLYSGKDKVFDGINHTNVQLVLKGWNYNSTRSSRKTLILKYIKAKLTLIDYFAHLYNNLK